MKSWKIAIVILNYKGLKNTLDCLESLKRCVVDMLKVEIIVIDNGSKDGSDEALSKLREISFIENRKNLGFAAGNNIGVKKALQGRVDYILILNNDTVVDNDLLINFLNASEAGDIISPKIYFAPGFEFHKERYKKGDLGKIIWFAGAKIDWDNIVGQHIGVDEIDTGQFSERKEIDLATGACMFIKRKVFEKIGYFDEKYFLYLEDMDFCVRAKKAGFKIIFEPKAIIWHKNAGSAGGSGSALQDYFISRNRLLFAFKYAKLKTKFAVLRHIASGIKNPAKKKAIFDFLTLNFGRGSFLK